MVTAIRLVPIFEEEATTVYQAQLARGIQYDRRNFKRVLDLSRQFFFPLLVSVLSKVDALAVSMEGRAFGKYPRRTYLREVNSSWRDVFAIAALLLMGSLVLLALR